jgi:hypothetical protein
MTFAADCHRSKLQLHGPLLRHRFRLDISCVATKISSCFYESCFVAGKFRQSFPGWEEPIVRFPDEIETPSVDNQESREDDVRNGIELDGDSLYQFRQHFQ